MIISIPREIMPGENRVAATPETVEKLIRLGYEVFVEKSAGRGIYRKDEDYADAGAVIVKDTKSLYGMADIVLKVKEPIFNQGFGMHEIDMLREGATLIAFLHPAAPGNHEMVEKLKDKNITAFTMDGVPRISRAQRMDALTSMSTVTGYKSALIAASNLPVLLPTVGTAIGLLKPGKVLIVGAGVVGLQAIATLRRIGAVVSVVDIQRKAREAALSLGAKISGFEIPDEIVCEKDGFAKALPETWLQKERDVIFHLLLEADAAILSALIPGEVAPLLITREMVAAMKPGAVIVDVAIDQGGNCETTVPGERYTFSDVLICGIKNIPGSVPVHATWLYAHNIFYFVENLYKNGPGKFDTQDEIVRGTLVTAGGKIFYEGTLKAIARS